MKPTTYQSVFKTVVIEKDLYSNKANLYVSKQSGQQYALQNTKPARSWDLSRYEELKQNALTICPIYNNYAQLHEYKNDPCSFANWVAI